MYYVLKIYFLLYLAENGFEIRYKKLSKFPKKQNSLNPQYILEKKVPFNYTLAEFNIKCKEKLCLLKYPSKVRTLSGRAINIDSRHHFSSRKDLTINVSNSTRDLLCKPISCRGTDPLHLRINWKWRVTTDLITMRKNSASYSVTAFYFKLSL